MIFKDFVNIPETIRMWIWQKTVILSTLKIDSIFAIFLMKLQWQWSNNEFLPCKHSIYSGLIMVYSELVEKDSSDDIEEYLSYRKEDTPRSSSLPPLPLRFPSPPPDPCRSSGKRNTISNYRHNLTEKNKRIVTYNENFFQASSLVFV
mgnify:FL=1